jgi:CheY-like chemotaxis protein
MHGGSISAHSGGSGMGSEFIIELPIAAGAAQSPPSRDLRELKTEQTEEMARLGARVLVVDDNQDAARVLQRLLQILGCTVEVAYDGPSALKTARLFQPSIALVDIGLPVMDGYELAPRLREVRDLRLVAVTGYGQKTDKRRARDAGLDLHVVKPVDLMKLERVMQDLMSSSQRLHEA